MELPDRELSSETFPQGDQGQNLAHHSVETPLGNYYVSREVNS
jgi:hypothetical protein